MGPGTGTVPVHGRVLCYRARETGRQCAHDPRRARGLLMLLGCGCGVATPMKKLCECGCGKEVSRPGSRRLNGHKGGVSGVRDRFFAKVEKTSSCWIWTSAINTSGYGHFYLDGRAAEAHRVAYTLLVGPIPDGFTLDHLCHHPDRCAGGKSCPHRRCVNPDHLEPVTRDVNTLRGGSFSAVYARRTHCQAGHPFTKENIYALRKDKRRRCKICVRNRAKAAA
jgi:hypothetical protein